jgi:hypothetical protein
MQVDSGNIGSARNECYSVIDPRSRHHNRWRTRWWSFHGVVGSIDRDNYGRIRA